MSPELNHALVLVCATFGIVSFLFFLTGSTSFRFSILIALEFWTAGGLINLSGNPTWLVIATAAALIAIRKMANFTIQKVKRN